jgi:hypothetical protein
VPAADDDGVVGVARDLDLERQLEPPHRGRGGGNEIIGY